MPAPITAAAARESFKFTSLPTELRLIIWRETFEPRILHITSTMTMLPRPIRVPPFRQICLPNHVRFKAPEPPPIALQICRESRALALEHYISSFHSTTTPADRARERTFTAVYFCPEPDIVHIADDLGIEFHRLIDCTGKTARRIKTLAVSSLLFKVASRSDYAATFAMIAFRNLEKLILVVKEEVGDEEEGLIREHAEGLLLKVQRDHWSVLRGHDKERKVPAVKVMNPHALENDF